MKTFYLDKALDEHDILRVEEAVRSEGYDIELAEVLYDQPAINVHGPYSKGVLSSLKYFLNLAGAKIIEVA